MNPIENFKPLTLAEASKEVDYWKVKYIDLLEEHNEQLYKS
ncbi:hypothetical protein GCM10028827_33810 [Mucilaginibacter myungsuensis]